MVVSFHHLIGVVVVVHLLRSLLSSPPHCHQSLSVLLSASLSYRCCHSCNHLCCHNIFFIVVIFIIVVTSHMYWLLLLLLALTLSAVNILVGCWSLVIIINTTYCFLSLTAINMTSTHTTQQYHAINATIIIGMSRGRF